MDAGEMARKTSVRVDYLWGSLQIVRCTHGRCILAKTLNLSRYNKSHASRVALCHFCTYCCGERQVHSLNYLVRSLLKHGIPYRAGNALLHYRIPSGCATWALEYWLILRATSEVPVL